MSFIRPADIGQMRQGVFNGIGVALGVLLLYLAFEQVSPRLARRVGRGAGVAFYGDGNE